MENPLKGQVEKDAAQIVTTSSEITSRSPNREVIETNGNSSQTRSQILNQNMMVNQTNASTVMTFNDCHGLTFGSVFNFTSQSKQKALSKQTHQQRNDDESVYQKTPTIKEMLESCEPITSGFLDHISGNFGSRWREVTVLLSIDRLFVDRMYEDYFIQGGTKEVLFKVLSKYQKEWSLSGKDELSLGLFMSFLWNNGFRKAVWHTKEYYKQSKELERYLE